MTKYIKKIFLILILVSFQGNSKIKDAVVGDIKDSLVTRVIYKISNPSAETNLDNVKNLDIVNFLKERNKAYDLIECELLFNKNESFFKIIDKLDLEIDKSYGLVSIFAKGEYYKNIIEKTKIKKIEIHGEQLNITLPYEEYKWEISNESKTINGYLCYKAICRFEELNYKTNKMNVFYPEVWFTPEIPSSFGPRGLDGLPGLVLEGKFNNHAYFYATQITFKNSIDKIRKPTDGKKLTFEEYQTFLKKIYDERILLDSK